MVTNRSFTYGTFYRVTTDNLFPYNVYGGVTRQLVVKIARRHWICSIGKRDWSPSAGGESAFSI